MNVVAANINIILRKNAENDEIILRKNAENDEIILRILNLY